MHLFFEELDKTSEKLAKRYNIKLLSVNTDGFMALGKNAIDLDIPGITRIVAANVKELLESKTTDGIVKPELDTETLNKLTEKKEKLVTKNKSILELKVNAKHDIEDFDSLHDVGVFQETCGKELQFYIDEFTENIEKNTKRQKEIVDLLLKDNQTQLNDIDEVLITKTERINSYIEEKNKSNQKIKDWKQSIESGVCKECKRPFGTEDEWKEKVKELQQHISHEESTIDEIGGKITAEKESLSKLKELQQHHKTVREDLLTEKTIQATSNELKDLPTEYEKLTKEISTFNASIYIQKGIKNNLSRLTEIKYGKGKSVLDIFPTDSYPKISEKIKELISKYDILKSDLDVIEESIDS
ncbi:MAG: hypothetical protein EZS28_034775, partial [Streblomastix strix]